MHFHRSHTKRRSHTNPPHPLPFISADQCSLISTALILALAGACSSTPAGAPEGRDESAEPSADSNRVPTAAGVAAPAPRVVGYLPNYRKPLAEWAETLNFSYLTHVNLAFADIIPGTDGAELKVSYNYYDNQGVAHDDEQGLDAFVQKAHEPANDTKVCLSIGGAKGSANLAKMLKAQPLQLASSLVAYLTAHDLDCIDVDQEEERPDAELEAPFGEFIRDLTKELEGTNKQMSAAVVHWNGAKILPVLENFDFLNVMAYDFNGPYSSTTPVQASSIPEAQAELDSWVADGAEKSRLVLGVPFYGFKWRGGSSQAIMYGGILEEVGGVPTEDQVSTDEFTITLNSSGTIRTKAQRAKTSYGGIMIWELSQDAAGADSLLKVIHDVVK